MDSLKVFIILFAIFAGSVSGKPFSIDIFGSKDFQPFKNSDVVKRQSVDFGGSNDVAVLSGPKISLSSLIDNIESGLVQTALSVGNVGSNPNAHVNLVTPAHQVNKRSTEEAITVPTAVSDPIVLVQTTERVNADSVIPAHVVIDRVSVYKAPEAGASLLPTFHLQSTSAPVSEATPISTTQSSSTSLPNSSASPASDKSSEKQSESSTTETTASPSSTTVTQATSTSTSTSASTTTLHPVDEKKSVEKELKNKVAEVEAEPVILTARV